MRDEMPVQHHKDLKVWQASRAMVKTVYELSALFPKEEIYGLTSQLRRCAISVPSNIAEGAARPSRKEYQRFVGIALGSLAEMETQLFLALDLQYIAQPQLAPVIETLEFIRRMLINLYRALGSALAPTDHPSPITDHPAYV